MHTPARMGLEPGLGFLRRMARTVVQDEVDFLGRVDRGVQPLEAMACQPPILLGDEPTGNLDTGMAREMFQLLKVLNENGTTVVYVTHDQALAGLASRIVSVRDGQGADDAGRRQ